LDAESEAPRRLGYSIHENTTRQGLGRGTGSIAGVFVQHYNGPNERLAAMFSLETLRTYRDAILQMAAKYGVRNVRVFGSVARGDSTGASDIDFLVELDPGRSLIDRIGFMQELEQLLGQRIDVVNERALHRRVRDRVLREVLPL
jgi:hypothetical protein